MINGVSWDRSVQRSKKENSNCAWNSVLTSRLMIEFCGRCSFIVFQKKFYGLSNRSAFTPFIGLLLISVRILRIGRKKLISKLIYCVRRQLFN